MRRALFYMGLCMALLLCAPAFAQNPIVVEGESGSGDGVVHWRSNASQDQTIWLNADESRDYSFNVSSPALYEVIVRYSNDNWGALENVTLSIDSNQVGTFQAQDTGDGGAGWNIFQEASLGTTVLASGTRGMNISVAGGDGYGVEIDTVTFIVVAEPITIEGESGTGDGTVNWRSNASQDQTVWLNDGETRTLSFSVAAAGQYSVEVRYSNDNYGPLETVTLTCDGDDLSFQAQDTGDYGLGWNIFQTASLGDWTLASGNNTLDIDVSGGDGYGVEIDKVTLTPTQ
jgi:hypothetical protein